jgi:predicted metalloendopeptidase
MTSQTVNAYYHPAYSEVVFPAAILQPPFFDPNADPAVNYGAIGAVIGHELSHGFDDQGSKSDEKGVQRNWWTEKDRTNFEARTKLLVQQYAKFEPLKGQAVNGELTLGENIGDLGGVSIALHAYQRSLGGKPAPVIDGYSGEQRFFLSWAQVWLSKQRDEYTLRALKTDPHSPPKFRVNGVVANVDAWYDAFGVQPGDPMYLPPKERVQIW